MPTSRSISSWTTRMSSTSIAVERGGALDREPRQVHELHRLDAARRLLARRSSPLAVAADLARLPASGRACARARRRRGSRCCAGCARTSRPDCRGRRRATSMDYFFGGLRSAARRPCHRRPEQQPSRPCRPAQRPSRRPAWHRRQRRCGRSTCRGGSAARPQQPRRRRSAATSTASSSGAAQVTTARSRPVTTVTPAGSAIAETWIDVTDLERRDVDRRA